MPPDAFQLFDGVSVRGIVVFERLDALNADSGYQIDAVLLLIAGQLNIAVMALFIDIVLVVAQVGCFPSGSVMPSLPLNGFPCTAADARQVMVTFTDIIVNDTLGHVFPVLKRFHRSFAFAPGGTLFFSFAWACLSRFFSSS